MAALSNDPPFGQPRYVATRRVDVWVTLDGRTERDVNEAFARITGRVRGAIPRRITLLNGRRVKVIQRHNPVGGTEK